MKRLKVFVITLAGLFTLGKAFSQKSYIDVIINYTPTNFHYGDLNSELKDYKKSKGSLQIGASFQAGVTPHLSMVSELYLMMQGGRLLDGNPLTGMETSTRLYTLEMPVMARVHFGNFYLNGGGSTGYNLLGNIRTTNSETGSRQTEKMDFGNSENAFKRLDAGVQFGAGCIYEAMCCFKRRHYVHEYAQSLYWPDYHG